MKHINANIISKIAVFLLAALLLAACGKKDTISVEDEVASEINKQVTSSNDEGSDSELADAKQMGDNTDSGIDNSSLKTSVTDSNKQGTKENNQADDTTKSGTENKKTEKEEVTKTLVYIKNPFLGYNSKATDYKISFSIDTDSGIAGFVWGFTDDDKPIIPATGNRLKTKKTSTPGSDYYLYAIELKENFPRLYTSRRAIDANDGTEIVYEEEYTNLDMMYPEMSMYLGVTHYIDIEVSGTLAKVYLDSVEVYNGTLHDARAIGQIGTWVEDGNYHAYFDDLFIAEGTDGSGDYIYSEDFAKDTSVFNPYLCTDKGRLYAKSGLYFVPNTDGM